MGKKLYLELRIQGRRREHSVQRIFRYEKQEMAEGLTELKYNR